MIRFYAKQRFRQIARFFQTASYGRLITAGLFVLVIALVSVGVFGLLKAGFSSVADNQFLQVALPLFIYELFLLVIIGLVFVSSLIFGIFSLFQNDEDSWVLASPQYQTLLTDKLITVNLVSLWPLVVIALPALLAIQSVFTIGIPGLLYGFLMIILLGICASTTALVLIVGSGLLLQKLSQYTDRQYGFVSLITSISGVTVLLAGLSWWQLSGLDVVRFFDATNLKRATANVDAIRQYFAYFPSHWPAETLSSLQTNGLSAGLSASWPIWITTAGILAVYRLLYGSFLATWQHFQEGSFEARTQASADTPTYADQAQFSTNSLRAVFSKEWITLIRSKRNLLWLGFLLLLWLIVTGFDVLMKNNLAGDDIVSNVSAPELIQALQLVVVGYFLAAIILRFVFPAFSMERDTAWSIITAPLSRKRLFWAKGLFFTTLLTGISIIVAGVHLSILGGTARTAIAFIAFAVIMTITLTMTGLSFGARFPNFTTTDPEKLSTTLPGLAFIGIAVIYSSYGAYAYYLLVSGMPVISITSLAVLSIVLVSVACASALRKLPHTDFTARLES